MRHQLATTVAEDAGVTLTLSRRALLQSLAVVGASACTGGGSPPRTASGPTSSTTSRPGGATDLGDLLHRRLERSTFGVTPALLVAVEKAGGFEKWLDGQISGAPGEATAEVTSLLDAVESRLPALTDLRFESKEERRVAGRLSRETITGRTVFGAAFGADQLRGRVVAVLADLLHVSSSSQPELFGICDYDHVLREGAFGRFSDLLVASARHPAMLTFLDQASSRADGGNVPNENYAREVMELHTVGVDGGYDESDVKELAHVLSGWSIERQTRTFVFRNAWHDLGSLATDGDILGWRPDTAQQGEQAGIAVLQHLATRPATAHRLAHRFARSFVSDTVSPGDPLVAEAAEVYLDHDTAIGPLVVHLLTSDRFEETATLMLRPPLDLVAHTLRVAGGVPAPEDLDVTLRSLVGLMYVLGQFPYGWPAPNGYPSGSAAWSGAGAMIGRWNAMVTLGGERDVGPGAARLGMRLDPAAVGASDPAGLVSALCGPEHQVY